VFLGSLIVLVILAYASLFIVKEGEYKVVTRFGEAITFKKDPGLYVKVPFVDQTIELPKYQMTYENVPTQVMTKDKKLIIVDNYTVWRINDPAKFMRTIASVTTGKTRIEEAVYNSVRRKLSEYNYDEIVSEETARGDLNDVITRDVIVALQRDDYGIEIVDVRIKRTDLPDGNKESVYNRMISDRQSIAALYLSEGDEESRK